MASFRQNRVVVGGRRIRSRHSFHQLDTREGGHHDSIENSTILQQGHHHLSLLQFAFRSNIRRSIHNQRQREHQRRRRRRTQQFSCRKAFLFCWAFLGVLSYGIMGWLFLSVDETSWMSSGMLYPDSFAILTDFKSAVEHYSIGKDTSHSLDYGTKDNVVDSSNSFLQESSASSDATDQQGDAKTPQHDPKATEGGLQKMALPYWHIAEGRHDKMPQKTEKIDRPAQMEEWQRRAKLNNAAFGWVALPACFFFLILSIDRLWWECRGRSRVSARLGRRRFLFGDLQGTTRPSANANNNQERLSTVMDTLDLINQDRLERGEPLVSLDSYLAFQRVLSDRSIWIGLAEGLQRQDWMSGRRNAAPTADTRRKISLQQLEEICPQWKMTTEHASDEECSICLGGYTADDFLRTLPCHHNFHKDCIDRWMGQSSFCPICKHCLAQAEPRSH